MSSLRRTKGNKTKLYLLCVLVLAAALLITGLTFAYFTGRDTVTNKQQSKSVEIQLMEIRWEESGRADAAKLEPGMVIEKDPCVYNSGEADVYVRMRLVIKDASGAEILPDGENGDRYRAILGALYCKSGDVLTGENLLSVSGDTYVSQNEAFVYEDGWFYYKTESGYTVLKPDTAAPTLFDSMKIPVLKTEYNGIFDTEFTVEVAAQAISAEYKAEDVKAAFQALDGRNTVSGSSD